MTVYEKLMNVQNALVVNKTRATSRFNYRNAEDILEAVKPILKKEKAVILLSDETIQIDQRFYIKVTATFVDVESGENVSVSSCAREDETSKLMQTAQVTGSSISYARKYALGGLFCIDDGNDTDKHAEILEQQQKTAEARQEKLKQIGRAMKEKGVVESEILTHFGIESIKKSNDDTIDEIITWLNSIQNKQS